MKTDIAAKLKEILRMDSSDREYLKKKDAACDALLHGNWLGKKTSMRQEFVRRDDGSVLRICVAAAKNESNKNRTGVLWLHGGGYMMGVPEMDFMWADLFLEDDSAVMVLPDYRRSLEATYPAALDDAYLTLMWMLVNADRLGIRTDQIFVGGESAGGGLAAALCMYARDRKEINIAFQMPLYPMMDDRPTPSNTGRKTPVWDSEKNDISWKIYKGETEEVSKYCAPARETDYTGLPPAFTICGKGELFRDETKAYADHLYAADVPVMFREFDTDVHAFDLLMPFKGEAQKARRLERRAFRHAQENFFCEQPEKNTAVTVEEIRKLIEETMEMDLDQFEEYLNE